MVCALGHYSATNGDEAEPLLQVEPHRQNVMEVTGWGFPIRCWLLDIMGVSSISEGSWLIECHVIPLIFIGGPLEEPPLKTQMQNCPYQCCLPTCAGRGSLLCHVTLFLGTRAKLPSAMLL